MDDRRRKWVYWSTFGATFVLANLAWLSVVGLFGWLVGRSPFRFGLSAGGFYALSASLSLSATLATRRCRRLGLSLEGDATETLTRKGPVAADAPENVTTGTTRRAFAIAGVVLALIAAAICAGAHGLRGIDRELGNLMAGIFGAGAAASWLCALADAGRRFVADEEGVTRCSVLRGMGETIPWDRIARYDIRSQYNALGHATSMVCTLYNAAGKELIRLDLAGVSGKDRRQLLDAIRVRQGASTRSELMAGETPAGLGTELQAAEAPAGRGTEPEAEATAAPIEEPAERAALRGRERAS